MSGAGSSHAQGQPESREVRARFKAFCTSLRGAFLSAVSVLQALQLRSFSSVVPSLTPASMPLSWLLAAATAFNTPPVTPPASEASARRAAASMFLPARQQQSEVLVSRSVAVLSQRLALGGTTVSCTLDGCSCMSTIFRGLRARHVLPASCQAFRAPTVCHPLTGTLSCRSGASIRRAWLRRTRLCRAFR